MSKKEVESAFTELQENDRYENGHSYSGGFGMARGLKFRENVFATADEAYDWLNENAVKWEEALCVQFKAGDATNWMIGANCAS